MNIARSISRNFIKASHWVANKVPSPYYVTPVYKEVDGPGLKSADVRAVFGGGYVSSIHIKHPMLDNIPKFQSDEKTWHATKDLALEWLRDMNKVLRSTCEAPVVEQPMSVRFFLFSNFVKIDPVNSNSPSIKAPEIR